MTTKDIATVEMNPGAMIQMAVQGGADLDKLEKLMVLQERWEAGEARKAYNKAMAAFKENPPKIDKDKHVSFGGGKTSYNHASLANVTDKINSALSVHGLSASWKTEQNGKIVVTCRITHEKGHSEETSLSADADTSGSKNAIQAIGSTVSYLQRYTLLAVTGLATHDQDDDGKESETVEPISTDQCTEINDLLTETGSDVRKFLSWLKVESVEAIPAGWYLDVISKLNAKKDKAA